MGFESRAISARVTKQIVTIFSKTCDKRLKKYDAIFFSIFKRCCISLQKWPYFEISMIDEVFFLRE